VFWGTLAKAVLRIKDREKEGVYEKITQLLTREGVLLR
jgi:hypothetical protein